MSEELLDNTVVPMEDFFAEAEEEYNLFDEQAWRRGEGYSCPSFPMFDKYMEGLTEGLYMFAGESNTGKALELTTPLLLTNGTWTTIGECRIGQKVFGDDGHPTTIIAKSKIFTDHKCYKITFDDRSTLIADADHVWKVFKKIQGKQVEELIITTKDMLPDWNKYNKYSYRVPIQQTFEGKDNNINIHPYVLGLWLASGTPTQNKIWCKESDYDFMSDEIYACGYNIKDYVEFSDSNVHFSINNSNFISILKSLNLINNKHIPKRYLFSSINSRRNLLQGIMDGIGYVDTKGTIEITFGANNKVAENFGTLLSSLSIKYTKINRAVTVDDKEYDAIRFYFSVSKSNTCFRNPNKTARLRDILSEKSFKYKTIINIEEVESRPMQCIQVNNLSHCYCVGKELTVTHNTALALTLMMDYCLNTKNKLYGIYFSLDDTKEEVIPRVIASKEIIPISVASKPARYQKIVDEGGEEGYRYEQMLEKRNHGLQYLKDQKSHFRIVDGTKIENGEQMLDFCKKAQAYVKAIDPDNNIIICIDSLMDIRWATKNFQTDKQLNDYVAKEVKRWAAEELKVPIFGTLHLRKIEQNRRPNIGDVKESGRYAYEASTLFVVHNDMSRNKQNSAIFSVSSDNEKVPVIEIDWAKNKKSSYKGRTFCNFHTNYSRVTECSEEASQRFIDLIFS